MNEFRIPFEAFKRDPISSSLLLSLSLHLSLLALVQPAPGGGGMPETTIISARLLNAPPSPTASAAVEPEIEPVQVSGEQQPVPASPPQASPPLLTSNVPSPAPAIPVAPSPPETRVQEPHPPAPGVTVAAAQAAAAPQAAGGAAAAPQNSLAPIGIGLDDNWYLARQVDTHARALGPINPDYPEDARRREIEGTLKLMLRIDALGRVRDVEVVEAEHPGVFDEAAIEAFRNARFQPAMKDGRPVRYQAYVRVVFRLKD